VADPVEKPKRTRAGAAVPPPVATPAAIVEVPAIAPETLLAVQIARPPGRRPANITLPTGESVVVRSDRAVGLVLTAADVDQLEKTYRDQILVRRDGVAAAPRNPLDLVPDPRTVRERAARDEGGKASLYSVALKLNVGRGATVKVPDGTRVRDVTHDTPSVVSMTPAQHATFLEDWGAMVIVDTLPDDVPVVLPRDAKGEVQLPPKVQSRRRRGGR